MSEIRNEILEPVKIGQALNLIQFGGCSATVAGVLGLATFFIEHQPRSAPHEALYAVIDFGLMFAVLAIWVASGDRLGRIGFLGFIAALSGIASIFGPDPEWFGVDFYRLGSTVFAVGMAIIAVQLFGTPFLRISAIIWFSGILFGAASLFLVFLPPEIARALMNIGFLVAGIQLLRRSPFHRQSSLS